MAKRSGRKWRLQRDPEATAFAREQRELANEFAESVWEIVRNRRCRNQKFRREYPIAPYTADFCCVALKLIVEIDGEPHHTAAGRQRDSARDQYLAAKGFLTLRIPGYQVLQDLNSVRQLIESVIDERVRQLGPSPPTPLPQQS